MNGSKMKNDSGPEPDKAVVHDIINNIKSQGVFDQFRKECLADVDTKPAYQNLQSRVENYVNRFLSKQTWTPNLNKNQLRESLRKQINQSGMLTNGVERIIEQVVNPKIFQFIKPRIDEVVCQHLGIDPKQRQEELHQRKLQQQSSQLGATSRENANYIQNNPQYTQANWQPPNPFGAQNPNMPNMSFPPQFGFNPLHPTFQQIPGWGGLYPPGLEPFSAPPLPTEQPAAPGTEAAPLPPPAAPPPEDTNTPPPPEHKPEEETVAAEEQTEVKPDEGSKASGSPMDIDENSRGSSITEVEMTDVEHPKTEVVQPNPPETNNTDSQEANKKQYKFAWSKAVEEEIDDDVDGDLSSIHTSDLSSFEYSSPSENEEDKPVSAQASPVKSPVKLPQQTVQTSEQENTETVGESATTGNETTDVSPHKPRKLLSLTYNLSDSDDDETREERKARIAKEKEERYQKRLQRRAELEAKRKERDEERARLKEEKKKKDAEKLAVVDDKTESSQTESKTEDVTSSMETEDEKPVKKKKTKEERKEQLFQQKAMEKRMALRRQRTRNKRYTSEEFTSIFTSQKTPFSSQNYSQVVEEVETEIIETETIETETIEIDNTMNYTMENFQVSEVSVQTPPTPTQDEYPENVADIPLPDTPGPIELPQSALTSVTIAPSEGQEKIEESQLQAVSPESNASENSTPVTGNRRRSISGEGEAPTRRSQRHLAAVETRTRRESQRGKSPEGSRSKTSQRYDTSDLYKPRISRRRQTPPSARTSETPTASPSLVARSSRKSKKAQKTDSPESVQELEDGSVSVSCTLEVLQGQLEVVDAESGQLKTVSADLMDQSVVTMEETEVVETDVVSSDLLQGDVFEQIVEAGEIETGEVVIDEDDAEKIETKPKKISRRRHSSKSTRTSSRSTSRSRSHRTSRTSSRSSSRSRSRSRSRHSADRSRRSRSDDSRSRRSRSVGSRSRRSLSESRSYSTSRSYTRSRSYSRSGSYSRSRSHSRSRSYSRSYSKHYSKSRSRSRSRSKSLKSTETISEEEEEEDGELGRSKKPIEEVYFGEAERRMREVIRKPVEQISFGLAEQHARHRAPWPAGNWQGQKTRGRANFRVSSRGPYTNYQRGGYSDRGFRRAGVSPREDFSRSPTREAAVSPSKRYYPMGDSPQYNKSPSPTYRPISPGPFDLPEVDEFRDSPARYRPPSPETPPRAGYRPPSPGARPYRPPSPSGYHSASPTKTGYRRLERPPSPSSSHYISPPGSGYKSEPIHSTIRPSTPPPISGDLQTSPISSSPSEGQCTPSPVYDEPVSRQTPPSARPLSPLALRPQTPPHIDSPGVLSPPSPPSIRETRRTRAPSPPPVHFTRSHREKSPPAKRPRR